MNLLAKKFSLKNMLKPGLIMLIPVFFGCETSEDLGIRYDLGTDANIKFQEFTLPATNIYIDSLRTDGESRILVGSYTDPITGTVSAEGYVSYTYDEGPLPRQANTDDEVFTDTLQLDSMVFIIETNPSIPKNSTSFQEFSIYDLQDSLQLSAIYLSNLQLTRSTFAGTFSGTVNSETDTVFRVKLDDSYAQSFFDNISDISADPDRSVATTIFKSIGLVPEPGSQGISSIDLSSDTTRIIMYTSPVNPESKDTTYLTTFKLDGKNFTYLDRDQSSSEFAGIIEFQDFDLASEKTVIDPLSGITTAFSLTQLEEFFDQNRNILINNAILSFEFEAENERDTLTSFMSFFRKENDRIFGPATARNSFGNIMMSDQGYLSGQVDPAFSTLNDEKNKILVTSTLFYQQFYTQYLESDSFVYRNPVGGALIPIDDFVAISTTDLTLQRSVLKPNGITLRLYYTEVER